MPEGPEEEGKGAQQASVKNLDATTDYKKKQNFCDLGSPRLVRLVQDGLATEGEKEGVQ